MDAFDHPAALAQLRASLRVVFEADTEEELDTLIFFCRMVYVSGAKNFCRAAAGAEEQTLTEDLRRQWERLWWMHQPGGEA